MIEYITTLFVLLILVLPLIIFFRQILKVRHGTQKWLKATLLFAIFALLPIIIYALLIGALIAIEELTKLSIVTEGIARTFIFLVVIASGEVILLWLIFAIVAFFLRGKTKETV
jgi:hypothetical protein